MAFIEKATRVSYWLNRQYVGRQYNIRSSSEKRLFKDFCEAYRQEMKATAQSNPDRFMRLATASIFVKERWEANFDNRVWAIAKCGNPELAAHVFGNVRKVHPATFSEAMKVLTGWAQKDEFATLRALFQTLGKRADAVVYGELTDKYHAIMTAPPIAQTSE